MRCASTRRACKTCLMRSALTGFLAQRIVCGSRLLHGALAVRLWITRVSANVCVGHIGFVSRGGMHDNITTQLLDHEQSADLRRSVLTTPFVRRSMCIANAVNAAGVSSRHGHDAMLYIQKHDEHAKPTPVQALLASYPRFRDNLTAAQIAKLEQRQVEVQGRLLDMQLHALYHCAENLLSGHLSALLKSAGEFLYMFWSKCILHSTNRKLHVQQSAYGCSNFCLQHTAISSMSTSCSNYILTGMHERVHFSLQDQHYTAGFVSAWHHNILQCYAMPWCREPKGAAEARKGVSWRHNCSGCLAVCVS